MAGDIFPTVTPPSMKSRTRAWAERTPGSAGPGSAEASSAALGRLATVGQWMSACQGLVPPRPLTDVRVTLFAGDHGVAASPEAPHPGWTSTAQHERILGGEAAVNSLARSAGATVRSIDISLDRNSGPEGTAEPDQGADAERYRVRSSCGSIDHEDAMTGMEVSRALEVGRLLADEEVDSGAQLLLAGSVGIGNAISATALVGAMTRTEPVVMVSRGDGSDDAGWQRRTAAVRDAMFRVRRLRHDPIAVLRRVSSPDIAALSAFLAQAAVRRTPVLLDGLVVTAAAILAEEMAPGAKAWWLAGHRSAEPAHSIALKHLDIEPLLDLGLWTEQSEGALAALPLLKAATELVPDEAETEASDLQPVLDQPEVAAD